MDNNIIVKITGEADMTEAQLQLRQLTDRSKELESQMQQLNVAEKADMENLKACVKDEQRLKSEMDKTTKSYQNQKRAIIEEIAANEKSIASLKRNVSAYNAMNGAGNKLTQQIRAIREQLSQMEMAGDTSSQAFIDLSVQAAKLQDQMGDTQQQIRILASDTANLDAAMSIGQGVAGTFNIATSAMALLGGESEELEKAFLKVQAVMAIMNGLQQVANVLNKDSAANVVLRTALQKLFNREKAKEVVATTGSATAAGADAVAKGADTVATKAATKATISFNAALAANPAMAIVMALTALIAVVVAVAKSIGDDSSEIEKFNKKMQDSQKEIDRLNEKMRARKIAHSAAIREMEAQGATEEQLHQTRLNQYVEEESAAQEAYTKAKERYADAVAERNRRFAGKEMNEDNEQLAKDLHLDDESIANLKSQYQSAVEVLKEAQTTLNVEIDSWETKIREQQNENDKKRAEEIKAAEKQLIETRIALMADGKEKEIAQINANFDEKIAAIKGNSKAETDLRTALEQQRAKEIEKVVKKYADEQLKLENDIAKLRLQNEQQILSGQTGAAAYNTKKKLLASQAALEIKYIDQTVENEELKAQQIRAINIKLSEDLKALAKEKAEFEIAETKTTAENRVKEAEIAAMKVLTNEESSNEQIRAAREVLSKHDANLRDIRLQETKQMYEAGLINETEYQSQLLDIEREALEQRSEEMALQMQQTHELTMTILSFVGDMANEIFSAVSDNISQQLEALDNYYTTDAEEAEADASKKYITEKELQDKKLALKRKQAAVDKASAAFSIGLNTAMAIMSIWADPTAVWAMKIALTATTAALGATQLAIALAKPLPQYAKGRKGGAGEYALVGERGAELMYIPQGASIVPHDKLSRPELWQNYGLPAQTLPNLPHVDNDMAAMAIMQSMGVQFDYDRLGRAVAKNIPSQKAVSVSIDRNGIVVNEGAETHTILNRKYEAAWI